MILLNSNSFNFYYRFNVFILAIGLTPNAEWQRKLTSAPMIKNKSEVSGNK